MGWLAGCEFRAAGECSPRFLRSLEGRSTARCVPWAGELSGQWLLLHPSTWPWKLWARWGWSSPPHCSSASPCCPWEPSRCAGPASRDSLALPCTRTCTDHTAAVAPVLNFHPPSGARRRCCTQRSRSWPTPAARAQCWCTRGPSCGTRCGGWSLLWAPRRPSHPPPPTSSWCVAAGGRRALCAGSMQHSEARQHRHRWLASMHNAACVGAATQPPSRSRPWFTAFLLPLLPHTRQAGGYTHGAGGLLGRNSAGCGGQAAAPKPRLAIRRLGSCQLG